jgi:hypothetical protein
MQVVSPRQLKQRGFCAFWPSRQWERKGEKNDTEINDDRIFNEKKATSHCQAIIIIFLSVLDPNHALKNLESLTLNRINQSS